MYQFLSVVLKKKSVLLLALGFFTQSLAAQATNVERSNILFVFADDWGRIASAYSKADGPGGLSDFAKTPNFDAVAKQGVLFRRAFVNAPSCTPCRSSLLSGQHFWRTGRGSILSGAVWDQSIPVFPLLLKDSGYVIGKSHKVWSPGTPADAPYGERAYAFEKAGRDFNNFSTQIMKAIERGETLEQVRERLLGQVRQNFRDFLDSRPSDQPFCYWFGPTNTHRRWVQGHGKALWGTDPERFRGRVPAFLPDVPEVWEDLNDYMGEVSALDAAMGVLFDELRKQGLYEKTLIAISGDHGPPGFTHGKCDLYDFGTAVSLAIAGPGVAGDRVVDDFVSLPDLAPTFLEAGHVAVPDNMTARSLWPVLRSKESGLVDKSRDHVLTGRERHVDRAREGNLPYPMRAIRTEDYLLIINFRPERYPMGDPIGLGEGEPMPELKALKENTYTTFPDMDASPTKAWLVRNRMSSEGRAYFDWAFGKRPRMELYDLRSDPDQVKNVANEPRYRSVLNELEKRLRTELIETGDPRMTNDGQFFETLPMTSVVKRP